jgi:membrane protein DedA with SNARE-associated domain
VSDLATALIAWLAIYTYPVAAVTVLVGSIGVPLPSAMVVLAAGSISAEGDPDFWLLFGIILAAAVTGDVTSYSLGRWASHLVVDRFGSKIGLTRERIEAAERRFERWGGLAVLITRFLLTGLALPTNLAAGAGTYPLAQFLAYAVVGEAIWTGQFLALGWLFGPSWVSLLDYLDDAVTVLTTLALAVGLIALLVWLLRPKPGAVD